ncbi:MAG: hypothetical protein AAF645_22935 [Myxococcota bacterium]
MEQTLAACMAKGAYYRVCSMIEALTRIADPASSGLLVRTFEQIPYAWARPRILRALRACGAHELPALARESLWDCESEAREVAVQHVRRDADARVRLEAMRDDALEDERVRAAADIRLR